MPTSLDQPRNESTAWAGRLLLAPGRVIYLGPGAGAERHRHHAVQFLHAPDEPFTVEVEGRTRTTHAAIIPANAEHAIKAGGQRVALLLFEAHGPRGRALDRRARASIDGSSAPGASTTDVDLALPDFALPPSEATTTEVLDWCDAVTARLGGHVPERGLSHATRAAIAYLHETIEGDPRIEEAARRASLSATTLTHRFTREVGIPFRRLVLWVRIKRAVESIQRGSNLTVAALDAGFSDSAHLSRTFRATFGLSPSATLPLLDIEGSLWERVAGATLDRA